MEEGNKPMRIAQIMGKWLGGGVESVVMNYYRNINREKIQFDFICDEDSTNIPYKEIENLGGKVILIPPYQKLPSYIRKLKKVLQENKYEVIHSHITTLSVFPLFTAKMAGVQTRIAHSHSTTNKAEWKKNLIKGILKPFSKVFATDYMCCSEYAGRWLFGDKAYNSGKVYLLNNAINVEKFLFNEPIREKVRKNLNIQDNTIVIGHIGRFVKQKNHDFLIDIFNQIHKKNENTILLLVGQGPLQDEIKSKVDILGLNSCVSFLGQRNDVDEMYQAFDVFILPSLYEGLPVVGVEAQSSGLLCIFSDDMTKETKILDSTKFVSLSESADYWSKLTLDSLKNYKRQDAMKEASSKCFNIRDEAIKLEKKYFELIDKNAKKS
ncbi:MAG: glycosyltransferase family 1 protein [Clostridia bacterium]|nr:glycosyltransferase family 1 protein [Clostridia bacterium]